MLLGIKYFNVSNRDKSRKLEKSRGKKPSDMYTSFCTLPAHSWNKPFLQEVLVPFSGECYLETRIWVQTVLMVMKVSLLPGPLSGSSKSSTDKSLYTYISLSSNTPTSNSMPQDSFYFYSFRTCIPPLHR